MYYWQIDDGRIWSADAAAFVVAPDGAEVTALYTDSHPAGVDYLRKTIIFYGYDLGELKNRLEKIQEIQAEYAPQLTLLQEAKSGAEMRDDSEDITDIKAEYTALLQEMNDKIQAVPND